ncbi:hypothetical protein GOODEAATRI_004258 [Goodea atripinnis]|uniref:Uncharacterized protein n=1 Tax=Goodea atripinnis TaxID=208336 RepID=A0ABV0PBC2_9TELE
MLFRTTFSQLSSPPTFPRLEHSERRIWAHSSPYDPGSSLVLSDSGFSTGFSSEDHGRRLTLGWPDVFWVIENPVMTHSQFSSRGRQICTSIILVFQRVQDGIDSPFGRVTGPQHHRSFAVLNSGPQEQFHFIIPCFPVDPPGVLGAEKLNLSLICSKLTVLVKVPGGFVCSGGRTEKKLFPKLPPKQSVSL